MLSKYKDKSRSIFFKVISLSVIFQLLINDISFALAPRPGSLNLAVRREAELLSYIIRGRLLFTNTEEDEYFLKDLNNAEALLLSHGKILVAKDLRRDPLKLIRKIIHEEIEAILQIMAKEDRSKYSTLMNIVLSQKKLRDSYILLFPEGRAPVLPDELLANDMIAKGFELLIPKRNRLMEEAEISEAESGFLKAIQPIIDANKHSYFTGVFWEPDVREARIRIALANGFRFYQAASKKAERCEPATFVIDEKGNKAEAVIAPDEKRADTLVLSVDAQPQGRVTFEVSKTDDPGYLIIHDLQTDPDNRHGAKPRKYAGVGWRLMQAAVRLSRTYRDTRGAIILSSREANIGAQNFYETMIPYGLMPEVVRDDVWWRLEASDAGRLIAGIDAVMNGKLTAAKPKQQTGKPGSSDMAALSGKIPTDNAPYTFPFTPEFIRSLKPSRKENGPDTPTKITELNVALKASDTEIAVWEGDISKALLHDRSVTFSLGGINVTFFERKGFIGPQRIFSISDENGHIVGHGFLGYDRLIRRVSFRYMIHPRFRKAGYGKKALAIIMAACAGQEIFGAGRRVKRFQWKYMIEDLYGAEEDSDIYPFLERAGFRNLNFDMGREGDDRTLSEKIQKAIYEIIEPLFIKESDDEKKLRDLVRKVSEDKECKAVRPDDAGKKPGSSDMSLPGQDKPFYYEGPSDVIKDEMTIKAAVEKAISATGQFGRRDVKVSYSGLSQDIPLTAKEKSSLKDILIEVIVNALKFGKNPAVYVNIDKGDLLVQVKDAGSGIRFDKLSRNLLMLAKHGMVTEEPESQMPRVRLNKNLFIEVMVPQGSGRIMSVDEVARFIANNRYEIPFVLGLTSQYDRIGYGGVGLYLARRYARNRGGDITYITGLDGTVFTLRMPLQNTHIARLKPGSSDMAPKKNKASDSGTAPGSVLSRSPKEYSGLLASPVLRALFLPIERVPILGRKIARSRRILDLFLVHINEQNREIYIKVFSIFVKIEIVATVIKIGSIFIGGYFIVHGDFVFGVLNLVTSAFFGAIARELTLIIIKAKYSATPLAVLFATTWIPQCIGFSISVPCQIIYSARYGEILSGKKTIKPRSIATRWFYELKNASQTVRIASLIKNMITAKVEKSLKYSDFSADEKAVLVESGAKIVDAILHYQSRHPEVGRFKIRAAKGDIKNIAKLVGENKPLLLLDTTDACRRINMAITGGRRQQDGGKSIYYFDCAAFFSKDKSYDPAADYIYPISRLFDNMPVQPATTGAVFVQPGKKPGSSDMAAEDIPGPYDRPAGSAKRISEISRIELPQGMNIQKREHIELMVEDPLVRACQMLFDKGIRTLNSSANGINIGSEAFIRIDRDSLSPENLFVADKICAGANKDELQIPLHADIAAAEVEMKSLELAAQFSNQQKNSIRHIEIIMPADGLPEETTFTIALKGLEETLWQEFDSRSSEAIGRVDSYAKNDQSLIVYADDVLEKALVVDLEHTIKNVLSKQDIFHGGKIVLYAKNPANAIMLEKMIKRADPKIETIKITQGQLSSDGNEVKEADALFRAAKAKGARDILGLIRGPTKEPEDLAAFAKSHKLPIVIVGPGKGVYSFAQAIAMAVDAKMNKGVKDGWLIMLPPIRDITEDIKVRYEKYLISLQVLAAA